MCFTTEAWISVIVAVISIVLNVIQFLQNKRFKTEMRALGAACGNYLHVASSDSSERNELHARAEGLLDLCLRLSEDFLNKTVLCTRTKISQED